MHRGFGLSPNTLNTLTQVPIVHLGLTHGKSILVAQLPQNIHLYNKGFPATRKALVMLDILCLFI